MTRSGRFTFGIGLGALMAGLASCSDSPSGIEEQPLAEEAMVSDPVPDVAAALGAHGGSAAPLFTAAQAAVETDVVYITLPPRTASNGVIAVLRNPRVGGTVWVSMSDGGFDPVPFAATAGDVVQIEVLGAGGASVALLSRAVPPRRRPRVVRTVPPRGKTDVPVNQTIVIVFSEPVAASTLSSSSVQLFQGTGAVPGTVRLLDGTGAIAAFVSAAPLARNTQYRLQVTQAVRDLQGDALERGITAVFTTGQSSTGAPASITVSPDTVFMVGPTYQMTATVRDAAGNMLIDQPVTWSTSDPNGLTVSSTGLMTARAADVFQVIATVNELTTSAMVFVNPGPAASVVISPNPATVAVGDTIILTAMVRDASGILFYDPAVTWTSSAPAVATVAPHGSVAVGRAFGTVTGVSAGSVTITATSGAASGRVSTTVAQPGPVASVTVTPASMALLLGRTAQLTATLRDANGYKIQNRAVSWTSGNTAAATVDANGVVTGAGSGSAAVTATSEGVSGTASITITVINLQAVQSGSVYACGLTTSGAAYCWGSNGGQLGNGSSDNSPWPVAVAGGLTFSSLAVGGGHSCGLANTGEAYCWGYNQSGELGDGSTNRSSIPVAVTGGPSFVSLSAGGPTCGLTAAGAAYCWGNNERGQLGAPSTETCSDGTPDGTPCSTRPVAVSGGLTFSTVSAAGGRVCAVTTGGMGYCWGIGGTGQLGNGSFANTSIPVPVSGGLTFSMISAGLLHTCGVTTSGGAYCWGLNDQGQLGAPSGETCNSGGEPCSTRPVPVSGGLTFSSVSAGVYHTCGVTTSGAAYCWGNNSSANGSGRLGTGSDTGPEQCGGPTTHCSRTPVGVTGGLRFSTVSAGGAQSCGMTVGGTAYCWGTNWWGQLGNGSTTSSSVPVKVAGQP